jgi:APA family basic amino acid/polyamine antiporter
VQFPAHFSAAPGTEVTLADGSIVTAVFNLPAVIIVALVTLLLVIGVRESASANAAVVVVKVGVVLLVILAGAMFVNSANWQPFIPPNAGEFGQYGWSGILRGAGVIFFAYIGFDAISTAAQEARNPQRDMPFGILGSLTVCTLQNPSGANVEHQKHVDQSESGCDCHEEITRQDFAGVVPQKCVPRL